MGGKNQHYVPQFYLKQFKTPESRNGKERVHTYFKGKDRYIGDKMVEDIASEDWFYRITGEKPQIIDDSLTALENRAAPLLEKLIEAKTTDGLTYSDLHDLALFLSTQHHRTSKFRGLQSESTQSLLDAAKDNPQYFEDFIKENSQYTVPDIEAMLSRERIDLATRRLAALQLPPEQQAARMAELDTELEHFNRIADEIGHDMESYRQGKVSDKFMEMLKYLAENPSVKQAQSLQMSVPKLVQRLVSMEWSVQRYREDVFRLTSDSPLLLYPLAVPASDDDWDALSLYSLTLMGEVHFYTDEIVEDHPPMMFVFPLTPHLDLFITPDRKGITGQELLGQSDADRWNEVQVIQAHRFVFSANKDFSIVPKAVEEYLAHKEMVEELIPARMQAEPHLNKKQPRDKRWILLGNVNC